MSVNGHRKGGQGMGNKEHLAAGTYHPADDEKKGGVKGEKSVLLLPDDLQANWSAGDAV